MCTPALALVAPGPRVTKQTPGRPVSLPCASAIMAAPPSCRHTVTSTSASCMASSAARKLSPGTQNTWRAPCSTSWSTRIWPPVRVIGLSAFRTGEGRGGEPIPGRGGRQSRGERPEAVPAVAGGGAGAVRRASSRPGRRGWPEFSEPRRLDPALAGSGDRPRPMQRSGRRGSLAHGLGRRVPAARGNLPARRAKHLPGSGAPRPQWMGSGEGEAFPSGGAGAAPPSGLTRRAGASAPRPP